MRTIAERRIHHIETRKMLCACGVRANPSFSDRAIRKRLRDGDVASLDHHRRYLDNAVYHRLYDAGARDRLVRMQRLVEEILMEKTMEQVAHGHQAKVVRAVYKTLRRRGSNGYFRWGSTGFSVHLFGRSADLPLRIALRQATTPLGYDLDAMGPILDFKPE